MISFGIQNCSVFDWSSMFDRLCILINTSQSWSQLFIFSKNKHTIINRMIDFVYHNINKYNKCRFYIKRYKIIQTFYSSDTIYSFIKSKFFCFVFVHIISFTNEQTGIKFDLVASCSKFLTTLVWTKSASDGSGSISAARCRMSHGGVNYRWGLLRDERKDD